MPNPVDVHGRTLPDQARRPNGWFRKSQLLRVTICAIVCAFLAEVLWVIVGPNIHTVLDGRVYRSAQPNRNSLAYLKEKYGLKTVVNLRGTCPHQKWYQDECQATAELGLFQEDLCFSAGRLPSSSELRCLVEVLEKAQPPLLLHCRRGSDRTGLAAAITLLLQDDISLNDALAQMDIRYAHLAIGRTAFISSFFGYYRNWLDENNLEHTPERFRDWAKNKYRGAHCQCTFLHCDISKTPIKTNQPFAINVKLLNSGSEPWRFSPVRNAGIHIMYSLFDEQGKYLRGDRAGFLDATIEPGKTIDLTISAMSIEHPGNYKIILNMLDEQMGSFYQMGSDPFEMRLEVSE